MDLIFQAMKHCYVKPKKVQRWRWSWTRRERERLCVCVCARVGDWLPGLNGHNHGIFGKRNRKETQTIWDRNGHCSWPKDKIHALNPHKGVRGQSPKSNVDSPWANPAHSECGLSKNWARLLLLIWVCTSWPVRPTPIGPNCLHPIHSLLHMCILHYKFEYTPASFVFLIKLNWEWQWSSLTII